MSKTEKNPKQKQPKPQRKGLIPVFDRLFFLSKELKIFLKSDQLFFIENIK